MGTYFSSFSILILQNIFNLFSRKSSPHPDPPDLESKRVYLRKWDRGVTEQGEFISGGPPWFTIDERKKYVLLQGACTLMQNVQWKNEKKESKTAFEGSLSGSLSGEAQQNELTVGGKADASFNTKTQIDKTTQEKFDEKKLLELTIPLSHESLQINKHLIEDCRAVTRLYRQNGKWKDKCENFYKKWGFRHATTVYFGFSNSIKGESTTTTKTTIADGHLRLGKEKVAGDMTGKRSGTENKSEIKEQGNSSGGDETTSHLWTEFVPVEEKLTTKLWELKQKDLEGMKDPCMHWLKEERERTRKLEFKGAFSQPKLKGPWALFGLNWAVLHRQAVTLYFKNSLSPYFTYTLGEDKKRNLSPMPDRMITAGQPESMNWDDVVEPGKAKAWQVFGRGAGVHGAVTYKCEGDVAIYLTIAFYIYGMNPNAFGVYLYKEGHNANNILENYFNLGQDLKTVDAVGKRESAENHRSISLSLFGLVVDANMTPHNRAVLTIKLSYDGE